MNETMAAKKRRQSIFYALIALFFILPLAGFVIFLGVIHLPRFDADAAVKILRSPDFFLVYFVCFAWLFCTLSIPLTWAYYDVFLKARHTELDAGENSRNSLPA